jgi:Flp pilus assembly protein TadG
MQNTIKENLRRIKQRGQSVVEISLITPLVLMALYVPADFGVAFLTTHLVQNAVREGGRIGSGLTSGDPDKPIDLGQATTIKDAVFARLPKRLSNPSVSVKFYFDDEKATCMQVVEVTTTGSYDFGLYRAMALFGVTTPVSEPIIRTTQMRYSYQRADNSTPICTAIGFEKAYAN